MNWKFSIVVSLERGLKPFGISCKLDEIEKIKEIGYDGIELFIKDPSKIKVGKIKETCENLGLRICGVGTGASYGIYGLSLTSPSVSTRKKVMERIEEYAKVCSSFECLMIIGSMKGNVTNYKRGWKLLVSSLKKCNKILENYGVYMVLEPLNRYESNIINTAAEAKKLIDEVGGKRIFLMLDTFHMNIEERNIKETIRKFSAWLKHIHFADSNRLVPGLGHLNFKEILSILKKINYKNFISIEILPPLNRWKIARMGLNYLKKISTNC